MHCFVSRARTPEPGYNGPQSCIHTAREDIAVMGLSVRTPGWRGTFWMHWDGRALGPDFGRAPVATELYEHDRDVPSDFDHAENSNVFRQHPGVVDQLFDLARRHWGNQNA